MILCYNRGKRFLVSRSFSFPSFRTVAAVRNFYDRLSHPTVGLSTSYKKKPINIPVALTLYAPAHHHDKNQVFFDTKSVDTLSALMYNVPIKRKGG